MAAPANAAQLHCGSTITKSTTLTQDITDCPGVGLRIGADDITLDLNGHTVAAAAKRNPKAHGILNEGYEDVTITGGTVRGFGAYGVRLSHADRNVVRDMRMTGNWTGIGLFESDRGRVSDNVMTYSKFVGANLTGGKRNRIAGNEIADSHGPGVFVHSSPDEPGKRQVVDGNTLTGNGIEILAGPQRTRVVRNTITGARGDGIMTFEPSTLVGGNTANDNALQGIYAPNGATDRGGNSASGNAIDPQCEGVDCV
ncbi:MAG TPA: right-handed parallel beta-helix repeat-containing protein [Solirubrobacteraceae bacterium]|nr:right-handed parallel beta-helix repeat-containing protein [Solirubrobacteraceae bacterium]